MHIFTENGDGSQRECTQYILTGNALGYVHTVPDSETERRRSVPDRASVHTRNAAFEEFPCSGTVLLAPLLKVERSYRICF